MRKVYVFKSRGISYVGAKVPSFSTHEIGKSWGYESDNDDDLKKKIQTATQWQLETGSELWGKTRFSMYLLGQITSQNLRGNLHSVAVYLAYSYSKDKMTKYEYIRVEWRDKFKKTQSKSFSRKQYGCLIIAEHEATIFAASLRAKMTGGELHLPKFEFDLKATGKVRDKETALNNSPPTSDEF